jgi:hypothetical protein
MKRLIASLMVFCSLGACTLCRQHPVACGIAGTLAIGAVTYAATRHGSPQSMPAGSMPARPPCSAGAC